jgi:hypothetical protein
MLILMLSLIVVSKLYFSNGKKGFAEASCDILWKRQGVMSRMMGFPRKWRGRLDAMLSSWAMPVCRHPFGNMTKRSRASFWSFDAVL